jgi:hypothetical protein
MLPADARLDLIGPFLGCLRRGTLAANEFQGIAFSLEAAVYSARLDVTGHADLIQPGLHAHQQADADALNSERDFPSERRGMGSQLPGALFR